jgi:AcrR family transcriptional regulator
MPAGRATLREKQATATRDHILGAAFELLVEHPDHPFSHESVAKAAGVGARTVYRYFPAQADLFEALWGQVRERSGTVFPTAEAEIVSKIGVMYRAFDQNEKLVRAVMESPAAARVRARGAAEGRSSFDKSLQDLMRGRSPVERRQVRAVFHGIHSGPFWQMLRDRGELSGPEAIAAASWAAEALLDMLRRERTSFSGLVAMKKKSAKAYNGNCGTAQ